MLRPLFFKSHEPRGSPAEDRDTVFVAQIWRIQDKVYLGAGPGEGIIRADHDLPRAGLGNQVAERFRCEHDGIEEELPVFQVSGRFFVGNGPTRFGKVPQTASQRLA